MELPGSASGSAAPRGEASDAKVVPEGRWLPLMLAMLVASLVASTVGLQTFLGSAHVVEGDATPESPRSYSPLQLLGLILFIFASPAAVGAAMGALVLARKGSSAASSAQRLVPTALLLVAAAACFAVGYWVVGGHELISCGVVWCYAAPSNKNDLTGFKAVAGSGLVALALGMLVTAVGLLWLDCRQPGGPPPPSLAALQRREAWKRRGAALAVLLALPLMLVLCGTLPNTWERFSRFYTTGWQGPTHSLKFFMAATCGVDGVMKSEHPDAWMVTINWVWSDDVVVKLFPDTLLYYSLLQTVVLVSALAAEFPHSFGRLLSQRLGPLQLGRWLLCVCFTAFLALFVRYWAVDHLYHGDGKYDSYPLETPARTFGVVAVMLMGLLLLPASKSSPVLAAGGLSWEGAAWAHMVLGVLFLLASCLHVVLYFSRFVEMRYPADVLPFNVNFNYPQNPVGGETPSNNFTVPVMATVFWPSLVCFGVLPWLRRRSYELFKQSHYMAVVLVPALLWHATHAWYFILPGLVLWAVDRISRLLGACEAVSLQGLQVLSVTFGEDEVVGRRPSKELHEQITKVSFTWPGQSRVHSPGMFVLVNFPQLALNEWHPFSLSSAPSDATATLHVKNMGDDTFTGRLHELAQKGTSCGSLLMNVQGPYGPKVTLGDASHVLLVAGGIGITPMLSAWRCALQQGKAGQHGRLRRLRLVWVVRAAALVDLLAEELSEGKDEAPFEAELSIFCSGAWCQQEAAAACGVCRVQPGRVNFKSLLADEAGQGQPLLVRACGPPSMIATCQEAAQTTGGGLVDFEPWSFVL